MTDRESFLQAMLNAPLDDRVRLVFADWLDEHEEPAPATRMRRWIQEIKPPAVKAWSAEGPSPDFVKTWLRLRTLPRHWWILADLLAKRLEEAQHPLVYSTEEWGDQKTWNNLRADVELDRHVKECVAFGLRSGVELKEDISVYETDRDAGAIEVIRSRRSRYEITKDYIHFSEAFARAEESDEPGENEQRAARLFAAVYEEVGKKTAESSSEA